MGTKEQTSRKASAMRGHFDLLQSRAFASIVLSSSVALACNDTVVPIPPETSGNWHPAWSPNSDEIAFVQFAPDQPDAIYVVSVTSGQACEIAITGNAAHLDWNAAGTRLALSIGTGAYVLDVTTKQLTPLADFPAGAPSFSPTNSDVVVLTSPFTVHEGLWLRSLSSGEIRRIPLPFKGLYNASWAPDGRRIVAEQIDERLFITDTLGVDTTYITDGSPQALGAVWSPRGDWIAYIEHTGTELGELWLIRPDGTGRRRLVSGAIMPSWDPSGSQIVFARHQRDGSVSLHIIDLAGKERSLVPIF